MRHLFTLACVGILLSLGCNRGTPKVDVEGPSDSGKLADEKNPKENQTAGKPQELIVGRWEGEKEGVPVGLEFTDNGNVILAFRITTSKAEERVDKGPARFAGTYKLLDEKTLEMTVAFGKEKVITSKIELTKDRLTVTDEQAKVAYQRIKEFSAKLTNPTGSGVLPLPSSVQVVNMLRTLGEEKDRITCLAFSPDSHRIATGGEDKLIRLWDTKTGEMKQILKGPAGEVRALVFSTDGSQLVSGGADAIRFWDAVSGKQATSPAPFGSAFGPIGLGEGGKTMLVTGFSEVVVFDVSGGKVRSIPTPKNVPIEAVAFSPDGKFAAIGHDFGAVSVVSTETGEAVFDFPKAKKSTNIYSLTFSADGKLLTRGGGQLTIWETSKGEELPLPSKVDGMFPQVPFSPDGKRLACAEYSGQTRVWDFPKCEQYLLLKGQKGELSSVAFSPDGKMLASVGRDGKVRIWELPDQK